MNKDSSGAIVESGFDIVTLGLSVVDVCVNPTDPWAWAGLVGDVIDLIPCVTGVGEGIKGLRAISKMADTAGDATEAVIDASKAAKNTGSLKMNLQFFAEKGSNKTNINGAINNGQPLNNHRVVSHLEAKKLPVMEKTNSSADLLNPDGSVKQRRYFGADGKVQMDIDFNHTDDGTHEFPHIHIWDWAKKPPRQDSRR